MKSLIKNSIYNLIYKGLNMLFPLVSSIYVSRILLPQGVGRVSLAQNVVSYFVLVAGLGLANYGTKEIGKRQNNKEETSRIFLELFIINFLSTLICSIIYYIVILKSGYFANERPLYMAVGLSLIFNFIQIDWFYQGKEEFQYIAIRSTIVKIISLICMFVFIKDRKDVLIYAIIVVMATGFNYIFNVLKLKNYITISQSIIKKISLKRHIMPAVILLASTISIQLYTRIDTTMLGVLKNEISVGYYTYAIKIEDMVVNLAVAVITILLPRMSLYYNTDKNKFNKLVDKANDIIAFVTIPLVIGTVLIADDIVIILFGEAFLPAANTIKILAPLFWIKSVGYLYGTQVLLTVDEEKKLLYSTIIGAVTNIIMNSFLIPRFSQNGAAFASTISELIVMCIQIVFARKYIIGSVFKKDQYRKIIISAVMMIVVILIVKHIITNRICLVLVECMVGAIVYFIFSYIQKIDIFEWIINNIKEKI